ncbi:MAG: diphosphomevalonate decarboxylase [Bacteroidetes bacterium]|nr:diphosphomevalonate decarboxylase [Bacteroidota bacterium]
MNKATVNNWLKEAITEVPSNFKGEHSWQSPSNIALVKYWGKHGNQLPNNPSISLTLSESRSETSIKYQQHTGNQPVLEFYFEGKQNTAFGEKIFRFLQSITDYFPFLNQLVLTISSKNTFPHSSGIASSASAMSALVMCILDLENKLKNDNTFDLQKASYFSRLGSGSASRSLFSTAALWGKTNFLAESADEYAIPLKQSIHPVFNSYYDSILIVDAGTKSVSSRAGHALMDNNPYANTRYAEANKHTQQLFRCMQSGDLDSFIQITEAEALQLHALMMTSNPAYILMQPNSLKAINAIRNFRLETKVPLCFTLDAGPNIHLLYPASEREKVLSFLQSELLDLCANKLWIDDKIGNGSSKIN